MPMPRWNWGSEVGAKCVMKSEDRFEEDTAALRWGQGGGPKVDSFEEESLLNCAQVLYYTSSSSFSFFRLRGRKRERLPLSAGWLT